MDGDAGQAQYHGNQSGRLGRTIAIFIHLCQTQKRVRHSWICPLLPMIIFIANTVGSTSGATQNLFGLAPITDVIPKPIKK